MLKTRTKTIYKETYVTRAVPVSRSEALKIAGEASSVYAVEQAEIEIPSLNNQRRIVCVLRFERIEKPVTDDAVARGVETSTV